MPAFGRTVVRLGALTLIAATAVPLRPTAAAQPASTAPDYLRILNATIAEGRPFEAAAIANREVGFRIVTAAAPPCDSGRSEVAYDFLLDARPWQRGVTLAAIPEIKPSARLTLRCDPARGQFVSSIPGAVTLESVPQPAGAYALAVKTRLRELPAVEFRWVAVARERELFTRIPASGAFAVWRIYERAMK